MKHLYISLLFCLLGLDIFAQASHIPNPVLPAPTAAALGKYAEIPVSNYTGIPQVSVPIYELKGRSLTLPISLSYHAGGIKTEENASWVGLGWSLNAGGVITRTVRGLDDHAFGGYSSSTFPNGELTFQNYFDDVRAFRLDSEPDLYFFNFNGYTGKFVLDPTDNPTPTTIRAFLIPKSDLEIIYDIPSARFIARTPEGIKYTFSETEVTQYTNYSVDAKNNPGVLRDTTTNQVTSWFVGTIESPVCAEKLTFSYASESYQYESSKKGTAGYRTSGTLHSLSYSFGISRVYGKVLSSISFSPNKEKIIFKSDKVREDLLTIPFTYGEPPRALEEIQVLDGNKNILLKKYVLNTTYFHTQAALLNVDQVPESEKYFYKRLKLNSIQEIGANSFDTKPPYVFEYNNINLPPKNSECQDHWGYINRTSDSSGAYNTNRYMIPGFKGEVDHSREFYGMACVGDPLNNQVPISGITYINVTGVDREPNGHAMLAGALKKITYPTGGFTELTLEPNKYAFLNQKLSFDHPTQGFTYQAFVERPGNNFNSAITNETKVDTFSVDSSQLVEIGFDLENSVGSNGLNFTNNEVVLEEIGPGGTNILLRLFYDWNPYYDPYRIMFFDESSQQLANLPLNISGTTYTAYDDTSLPANEGVSRRVIQGKRLVRFRPGYTYKLIAKREYDQWSNCNSPGSTTCLINNNFVNIASNTPVIKNVPIDSNTLIESLAGGLRVSQMVDKADLSSNTIRTTFQYRMHDAQGNSIPRSSGVILSKPNHYWNQLMKTEDNQNGCVDCANSVTVQPCQEYAVQVYNIFNIGANVPIPLATTQGSPIGYREVKVSKQGNGYALYRYLSPFDHPDQMPATVNARVFVRILNGSPSLRYREFSVAIGADQTGYLRAFIPTKAYDWRRGLLDSVVHFNEVGQRISGERNFYSFHEQPSQVRGLHIFSNNVEYNQISPPPEQAWLRVLQKEADYIDYYEETGWASLDKKIASTFTDQGDVYKYTEYQYGSANHIRPTLIKEKNSDLSIAETHITLSADRPSDTQTSPNTFSDMVDSKHMIYSKVKQEIWKNNQLVSGEKTNYKIESTNVVNSSVELANGGNYEQRIILDSYDALGNILSYTADSRNTSFVWGYGGNYPIIKVSNVDHTALTNAVGGQSAIDNWRNNIDPQENDIRVFGAALRNALPNALVEVYTYKNLIGMTSQTDAKGQTTYYEYDGFQRLKAIKDQHGNIIKRFDYHYSGQ